MESQCPCPTKSKTIYVNGSASPKHHTGKSWKTAFTTIDAALEKAGKAYGKVYVLVAQGVYSPVNGAFNMPNKTYLIGGFSGEENSRKDSCPGAHKTVISGLKFYGNLIVVGDGISNEPNQVSSVISNITVSDSSSKKLGGSVYVNKNCNLKIENVTFTNNYSLGGGAVYANDGKILVTGCKFLYNNADEGGGAILTEGSLSSATIKNSLFVGNGAHNVGGAIVSSGGKLHIESSKFYSNTSQVAGAVASVERGTIQVMNSKFRGNSARTSCGCVWVAGEGEIGRCTFDSNTSFGQSVENGVIDPVDGAGAVVCTIEGNLDVYNCVFSGNVAVKGNGGALINTRVTTISHTLFESNKALSGNGGAIADIGDSTTLELDNVEFRNNQAPNGKDDNVYVLVTS